MSTTAVALGDDTFEFLRRLVHEHSAIELEPAKGYLLESRLLPIARQYGFDSLDSLVGGLRRQEFNGLHEQVVEAMTTNETSFFRDLHPFDCFRTQVLPELTARRAASKTLNIWSGACASGQEPYTLAMILREHFAATPDWGVHILATDLAAGMLERARQGLYNQAEVNRGLPAAALVRYFDKVGLQWQIKEELRRMVQFQKLNLVAPWPPLPPMDVIFLRNVLIYFSCETKRTILARLRQTLKPDGYLVLGAAETTINLDDSFERVQFEKTSCYKLRG